MSRELEPEVMEGDIEASAYDELDRLWGDVLFQGFAESALGLGVEEGRVLDVGTGSGRVALRLARLNPAFSIEGIDLSHAMLNLARKNAASEGVSNVHFTFGDAKHLPYQSGAFDLVICHQFLHQLADPVVALREIMRVAKADGAILVRDIRRLPKPFMTLALPLWCLRYSPKLREQTYASFHAALTRREFHQLVAKAGLERATFRTHLLTHQTVERRATRAPVTRRAPPSSPHLSWIVRVMKRPYVTR